MLMPCPPIWMSFHFGGSIQLAIKWRSISVFPHPSGPWNSITSPCLIPLGISEKSSLSRPLISCLEPSRENSYEINHQNIINSSGRYCAKSLIVLHSLTLSFIHSSFIYSFIHSFIHSQILSNMSKISISLSKDNCQLFAK